MCVSYNILPFFFPSLSSLSLFSISLLLMSASSLSPISAATLLGHSCCQLSFISPSSSIYKSSFPNHSLSLDVLRVLSFFIWCLFFFFLFFWGCFFGGGGLLVPTFLQFPFATRYSVSCACLCNEVFSFLHL